MVNSTSNHFTCPKGGTWYVCPDEPHFVGCCSSDPCKNVAADSTSACPSGSLYAASFDTSIYDDILPNLCPGHKANETWYSCKDQAFVGCCEEQACKPGGCPRNKLLSSAWSDSRSGQFDLFNDAAVDDDKGSGLSGGAIAGIVVGAVAALVIVGALIWFFMRRRRNRKTAEMSGHGPGQTPSVVQSQHQSMYSSSAPPYQNSQYSSPTGTTFEGGNDPKYTPYSQGTLSPNSLSPGLTSESGRPVSELHSNSTRSEELSQQKWASGQSYGLGVHGAQKPEPIQELDSNVAEVHELDDGLGRNRS